MPTLMINGQCVRFTDSVKYLEIVFDRCLNWREHVKHVKTQCTKSFNLLKVIAGASWGADRGSMLKLYRSLIRSKLDYGCCAYGSASESNLNLIRSVQNAGLRTALGAFRSSVVSSLHIDAGELPLDHRRSLLECKLLAKILSSPIHPLFLEYTLGRLPPLDYALNCKRKHYVKSNDRLKFTQCRSTSALKQEAASKPPWTIPKPRVLLDLAKFPKENTPPYLYKQEFSRIRAAFPSHTLAFTDRSHSENGTGAAFMINKKGICSPCQMSAIILPN